MQIATNASHTAQNDGCIFKKKCYILLRFPHSNLKLMQYTGYFKTSGCLKITQMCPFNDHGKHHQLHYR